MSRGPVVEFDHHSPEYAADSIGVLRATRQVSPVAWTEAHGGFWIVTGYEEMRAVALDPEVFSSKSEPGPDTIFKGLAIPAHNGHFRLVPEEMDPPESIEYRKLHTGRLTPRVAQEKRERYREMADYCIDQYIEAGEIDLIFDLGGAVPSMATMELLGIPLDDWRKYAEPVHEFVYTLPESPDRARVEAAYASLLGLIGETIQERKKNPADDIISQLASSTVQGRPLTDQELLEMATLVVNGGIDTTSTLLAHTFMYLDEHPDMRPKLLADPELFVSAREEWLRFVSPVGGLARTVTKPVELAGSRMERGDRVMISWMGANHDPKEFENPDEVVLDRFPNRHCAFGIGLHRCLGSNIARTLFDVVLEQLLTRLPDYKIDRSAVDPYPSQISPGFIRMPTTFTPGDRVGAKL